MNSLISRRTAFCHPMELAWALGLGPEAVAEAIADGIALGWLAEWETATGPRVTLTPWAAERLGLHLVEGGLDDLPHWAPTGDPEPPARLPFPGSWEARDRHTTGRWIDRIAGNPAPEVAPIP